MRFHLREALRARLPFSALSLSLALSLQLIQVHLSVQFFVVAFRGRRKGAARRTRRKSCCRFRLWYFESWPLPRPRDWDPSSWIDCCSEQSGRGTERKHTHTHSPTSSVRPLLIVLYELVGKIPGRIGEEDWNHSIRHGGDVERGGWGEHKRAQNSCIRLRHSDSIWKPRGQQPGSNILIEFRSACGRGWKGEGFPISYVAAI